jgi:hypothetical protein
VAIPDAGEPHGGRLGLIDDGLAALIGRASVEGRRRALAAGIHLALGRTGVADVRLERAERALAAGRAGDGDDRAAVLALVDQLDQEAWRIQGEVEADRAAGDDYVRAFARARAAAAAGYAFEDDSLVAVTEGLYEAHHAVDDLPALLDAVTVALQLTDIDPFPPPTA